MIVGDKVSVFADLKGQCKRGFTQKYFGPTYFVGNGILVQDRKDLFTTDVPKYVLKCSKIFDKVTFSFCWFFLTPTQRNCNKYGGTSF